MVTSWQAKWCATAAIMLAFSSAASGAIIGFQDGSTCRPLCPTTLTGTIEQGDADKLVAWFKAMRFGPVFLVLDSPGGSVGEAIRIAQVVKKLALVVEVARDRVCASACFIVFAAGTPRLASSAELMGGEMRQKWDQSMKVNGKPEKPRGFVGLHRPFQRNIAAPENSQAKIMKAVTVYLEGQMLPRRLIDIMMTRPSNDIYWLNDDDLEELGEYPPDIEEYLIQKCRYDRNSLKKAWGNPDFKAILAEQDEAEKCIENELNAMQKKGFEELKNGWTPSQTPM